MNNEWPYPDNWLINNIILDENVGLEFRQILNERENEKARDSEMPKMPKPRIHGRKKRRPYFLHHVWEQVSRQKRSLETDSCARKSV